MDTHIILSEDCILEFLMVPMNCQNPDGLSHIEIDCFKDSTILAFSLKCSWVWGLQTLWEILLSFLSEKRARVLAAGVQLIASWINPVAGRIAPSRRVGPSNGHILEHCWQPDRGLKWLYQVNGGWIKMCSGGRSNYADWSDNQDSLWFWGSQAPIQTLLRNWECFNLPSRAFHGSCET